jgi:hypothetical protein
MSRSRSCGIACAMVTAVIGAHALAQPGPVVDAPTRAFELGRWEQAIEGYREVVAGVPTDGIAWLRIAQAQRELGHHAEALETLAQALDWGAPPAMVDLERARNLAATGDRDAALGALEAADHNELRALELLEDAREFSALRESATFQRVLRSVRTRVFPCESLGAAHAFDFWLGRWSVRVDDGTLVGHSTVARGGGGCTITEDWRGAGGSMGTGMTFFVPSKDQWRQVWIGSSGALIDMSGGLVDGVMRMVGTIEYVSPANVVAFRGSWTPLPDGQVHQRLEEFDLVGQAWRIWFEGYYQPDGS